MNLTQHQQWLFESIRACQKGREVLLGYLGRLSNVEEKLMAGLVSEADRESERVIKAHLDAVFPGFEFLGEESFFQDDKSVKLTLEHESPRWILDPLDGTTNYIHQFPIFCISLALEVKGEIEVAVIDVPMLKETYTAIRGQGAFVNGRPLKVSKTEKISNSLLATGFFADDPLALEEQLKFFSQIVREARGVRRPGAAAYDLALVARGVFDGFWEKNLKPWDTAAGILLVREAGGVVCTYDGLDYNPYKNSLLATNPVLLEELKLKLR